MCLVYISEQIKYFELRKVYIIIWKNNLTETDVMGENISRESDNTLRSIAHQKSKIVLVIVNHFCFSQLKTICFLYAHIS